MVLGPRHRIALGALGIALAAAVAIAAPWLVQPGYVFFASAALLCAAAAWLFVLTARTPAPADATDERPTQALAPQVRAPIDDDLRAQLETLRRTQGELIVARQASEAAMLAKDEFLATMSHEIRTPLNGVLPLIELVLSTRLSDEQRDHLGTAYRSAQEMLRIVDDILDYSKLDVGKLEIEHIALNLRELVDGVVQLMRRSAEAKGLRLGVSIDPNVRLAVRGDPVRLRQILMNLVSNAIKFTARGSVTVLVSRRGETPTAHEVAFAVRDTGIGMTAETTAKLFRPFAQGDASITRAFGGTGLGLVICKRLVDLMGGRIAVQSEPGKGSLFWFSVPLLKVIGDLPTQRDLRGVRALLVGSDETVLHRLQSALSNLQVQTTAAAGTTDALSKLRAAAAQGTRWQYDLVVVDATEPAPRIAAFARSVLGDTALAGARLVLLTHPDTEAAAIAASPRTASLPRAFVAPQLRAVLDDVFDAGAAQARAEAHRSAIADDDAALPRAGEAAPRPLRGRVLLVEDNAVNLQVARRLLALHGLVVDSAGDGEEALSRLAVADYDLVLMDCQMPRMDGYTATQRWRASEGERGARAVPIVAMTANAMAGDREKCLAAGMNDYLSKPLSRPRLEQTLLRWLVAEDAAPAAPAPADESTGEIAGDRAAEMPAQAPAAADRETAASPALDKNVLREMLDIMGGDFGLLVRVYLEETPGRVAELESAAGSGDDATMIAIAHTLKSSSANLGALTLAALARGIEEDLRASPTAPVAERVHQVRLEYERVAAEFATLEADSL